MTPEEKLYCVPGALCTVNRKGDLYCDAETNIEGELNGWKKRDGLWYCPIHSIEREEKCT
jgi:hypothetical protein